MALFPCPECQREISDQAADCPHCGVPLRPRRMPQGPVDVRTTSLSGPVKLLAFLVIVVGMVVGMSGHGAVGSALFVGGFAAFIAARFFD